MIAVAAFNNAGVCFALMNLFGPTAGDQGLYLLAGWGGVCLCVRHAPPVSATNRQMG